jgi:ribosomal protein L24E
MIKTCDNCEKKFTPNHQTINLNQENIPLIFCKQDCHDSYFQKIDNKKTEEIKELFKSIGVDLEIFRKYYKELI